MSEEEYLTIREAAEAIGVARATMFKLLKDHDVTRYQVAGSREIRIKRADLEALRKPVPRPRPFPRVIVDQEEQEVKRAA